MSFYFEKRKHFNDLEKALIVKLVNEKIEIIENKKIDAATNKAKEKAWEEITVSYNEAAQTGPRTAGQLHSHYISLKKKAKKAKAIKEMYKTGGATFTASKPVSNSFDSSAPLYSQCSSHEIQSTDAGGVEMDETVDLVINDYTVCDPSTSSHVTNNSYPVIESTQSASDTSISSAVHGQKKRKFSSTTAADVLHSVLKRKELKTNFDREIFQKKMEILSTELETKKNNLQHSELQLEHSKLQLEHVKIQLEIIKHKKSQIMKDSD